MKININYHLHRFNCNLEVIGGGNISNNEIYIEKILLDGKDFSEFLTKSDLNDVLFLLKEKMIDNLGSEYEGYL